VAKTKSFHAVKKVMIAVVNTPGEASGTITLRKACHDVAPSTWAACSISHGICLKKADMIQIDSGKVSDRYGMISPTWVSNRPTARQRLYSGVTRLITGKIDTASAVVRISFLPGKSSRAMAVGREHRQHHADQRGDQAYHHRVGQGREEETAGVAGEDEPVVLPADLLGDELPSASVAVDFTDSDMIHRMGIKV